MAFTRLSTAEDVKEYLENIDTSALTDVQIQGYIDRVDRKIRQGFGYPYIQIVTTTSSSELIYFLGEIDLTAVERVFYDKSEITVTTDFTVNAEKGLLTLTGSFTVGTKELRVWAHPLAFNELSAVRTALYIQRLSESFQRGEPTKNLEELKEREKEVVDRLSHFNMFEADGMGSSSFDYTKYERSSTFGGDIPYDPILNPYSLNEVRIIQDHTRNAYL